MRIMGFAGCSRRKGKLASAPAIYLIEAMESRLLLDGTVTRYYRFETDGGALVSPGQAVISADDSSGNGLNGMATGVPQYAATPFGSTVPLTGAVNKSSLFLSRGNSGDTGYSAVLLSGASGPILGATFTVESSFRLTSTSSDTGDVIQGGTITTTGNGSLLVPAEQSATLGSGTLDGVTLGTNLLMQDGATLTVTNGLTLQGSALTIQAGDGHTGRQTDLNFVGTQTLSGNGQIVFNKLIDYGNNDYI